MIPGNRIKATLRRSKSYNDVNSLFFERGERQAANNDLIRSQSFDDIASLLSNTDKRNDEALPPLEKVLELREQSTPFLMGLFSLGLLVGSSYLDSIFEIPFEVSSSARTFMYFLPVLVILAPTINQVLDEVMDEVFIPRDHIRAMIDGVFNPRNAI